MQNNSFMPLVEVTRGTIVESIHFGSVVITDRKGNIQFSFGDPELVTYLRSTAKPLQVLALLEDPASAQFNLTPQEIAIMCASHSGTNQHVAVLKELQKKINIQESDLQCGVHLPFDRITSNHIIRGEEEMSSLRHNCSGKHSGMLALAKILAAPQDTYLDTNNPTQDLILRTCAEMFSYPREQFAMGVDGCSAPVFAVPIHNAARAYATLCQPDDLPAARKAACQKITNAMMTHPFMVAGPERFDTALMQAFQGKFIAKTGAEGFFGVGILPNALYKDSPALGVMVKISDGDLKDRARSIVILSILHHLGFRIESKTLNEFDQRDIFNWRKIPIGSIRPTSQLLDALDNWEMKRG